MGGGERAGGEGATEGEGWYRDFLLTAAVAGSGGRVLNFFDHSHTHAAKELHPQEMDCRGCSVDREGGGKHTPSASFFLFVCLLLHKGTGQRYRCSGAFW